MGFAICEDQFWRFLGPLVHPKGKIRNSGHSSIGPISRVNWMLGLSCGFNVVKDEKFRTECVRTIFSTGHRFWTCLNCS